MSINTAKQNNHREDSLDLIRGIAVFTMILAHSIAFFHNMSSPLLKTFQQFGDTVSFTLFLLISGAVSYLAYVDIPEEKWPAKKNGLIKRLLALLIGYYLVALVSSFSAFSSNPSIGWVTKIIRILIFIDVPGYTEFLIPFVLYGLFLIIFRQQIRSSLKNLKLSIILSLILYTTGTIIFSINIPSPFNYYTSLFAGYQYFFRFPIFQYAPVFLGGLLLGKYLKSEASRFKRVNLSLKVLIFAGLFLTLSYLFDIIGKFPYAETFQRWPPTPSFLAVGLLFAFVIFTMSHCKSAPSHIKMSFKKVITFWGKNAFSMYFLHMIILQITEILIPFKTGSRPLVIVLFSGIITVCSALLIIFNNFKKSDAKNS